MKRNKFFLTILPKKIEKNPAPSQKSSLKNNLLLSNPKLILTFFLIYIRGRPKSDKMISEYRNFGNGKIDLLTCRFDPEDLLIATGMFD